MRKLKRKFCILRNPNLKVKKSESIPGQVAVDDKKVSRIVEEVAPLVEQTLLDLVAHTQHGFEVENDKLAFR